MQLAGLGEIREWPRSYLTCMVKGSRGLITQLMSTHELFATSLQSCLIPIVTNVVVNNLILARFSTRKEETSPRDCNLHMCDFSSLCLMMHRQCEHTACQPAEASRTCSSSQSKPHVVFSPHAQHFPVGISRVSGQRIPRGISLCQASNDSVALRVTIGEFFHMQP